jgi:ADP-ribose pyrophosphatase
MSKNDESGFRFAHKQELVNFGGFLKVDSYEVTPPQGAAFELVNVERGDSVSALIHIQAGDGEGKVRLVEQFRLPVAIRQGTGDAFVELPAVAVRANETPEQAVQRLCDLEGNVEVVSSELISHFYPSPGACSETIRLFYVKATPRAGGGSAGVGLVPVRHFDLPLGDLLAKVSVGAVKDAKCIIAAGWLQRKERA